MAAAANEEVWSKMKNVLLIEISEEDNESFLREFPSSSLSKRLDFTNHMSANYLRFAIARHWRSRRSATSASSLIVALVHGCVYVI